MKLVLDNFFQRIETTQRMFFLGFLSVGFINPLGKNSEREVMEKGSEINFDISRIKLLY